MDAIIRDPDAAAKETYDLVIIGGGIHGVMLTLEAARRSLRPLLIEQCDFGGATSHNSLRIIHGGLRYLQSLDFSRYRESVKERRWFLQNFPDLIRPLPCLMPVYGRGLRRPWIMRTALLMNDLLSSGCNNGINPSGKLPWGRFVSQQKTAEIFPLVDQAALKGGAIWYDAWMPAPQRVLIEALRWACTLGATALNYVEALTLHKRNRDVAGVEVVDRTSGRRYDFRTGIVVNATGPWCRKIAERFDRDRSNLFNYSLAWNLLIDRVTFSDHAAAITPPERGAQTYFLLPWQGKLLVGTGHAAWKGNIENPIPSEQQLHDFIKNINRAVPMLYIRREDVLRVFAGLLPAVGEGTAKLAVRSTIFDHATDGGPKGLYSVSGIKFTTSRQLAENALNRIFPQTTAVCSGTSRQLSTWPYQGIYDHNRPFDFGERECKNQLRQIISEESVHHLDDLMLRRTNLGDNPAKALEIAPLLCSLFNWDAPRYARELEMLKKRFLMDSR